MNTTTAIEHLIRCFRPEETIALLLRRDEPMKLMQRIVRMEQAIAPAYMQWLTHENANGINVYVAANPLRPGSRKRVKECIAEIRHLYLDIDTDGHSRLAALFASQAAPQPTAVVSTSPGKYQALWQVDGFHLALQESTLKQLAIAFGGDSACTDCNRVLRVPGFENRKYVPAHLVTVEYLAASVYVPSDFQFADYSSEAPLSLQRTAPSTGTGKHTHSERDWVWVLSELRSGKDAALLTHALAQRRADKPDPLYYAQRTVDMASARLKLLGGSSIQDVAADLEARRLAELPASLCSARAREIAHTAAHMIARQKRA